MFLLLSPTVTPYQLFRSIQCCQGVFMEPGFEAEASINDKVRQVRIVLVNCREKHRFPEDVPVSKLDIVAQAVKFLGTRGVNRLELHSCFRCGTGSVDFAFGLRGWWGNDGGICPDCGALFCNHCLGFLERLARNYVVCYHCKGQVKWLEREGTLFPPPQFSTQSRPVSF